MTRCRYNHQFYRFFFTNRFMQPKYSRSSSWVIFGISRYWFSPTEYAYKLHFFGLDFSWWFKMTII